MGKFAADTIFYKRVDGSATMIYGEGMGRGADVRPRSVAAVHSIDTIRLALAGLVVFRFMFFSFSRHDPRPSGTGKRLKNLLIIWSVKNKYTFLHSFVQKPCVKRGPVNMCFACFQNAYYSFSSPTRLHTFVRR